MTTCGRWIALGWIAVMVLQPLRADVFNLEEATIMDMQRAMAAGGLTSVQLVVMYLNRIQIYDRDTVKLNAVAQVNPRVLQEAAAMDKRRAEGVVLGPLHGIPILVKDSYDVAGLAASAGAAPLKNLIASTDAPVVKALKEGGAVILGKSNMWPFAYANDPDPDFRYAWGRTKNPYTLKTDDFGGSSTGSAAAVAANLCAFAMGGDTGSSIRVPSSRTLIVGGRPSAFLVPSSGTWPADESLDVIGPMARTVTDCAIALDVVVFDDPAPVDTGFFPPSSTVRPATYTANLEKTALAGKVVGLPKPYIGKDGLPLDPDVATLWAAAVENFKAAGATVKEIDWPFVHNYNQDTPDGIAHNYSTIGLTADQFAVDKDREWGDAYYFNQHLASYGDPSFTSVLDLPSPIEAPPLNDKIGRFKEIFSAGQAKSYTELGYGAAFAAFHQWAKRDVEDVMIAEGVDLLAFPTTSWADENTNLPVTALNFLNGIWEGSRLGLPEYVVPMGFAASGTPQGMMILGRTYYSEAQILGYAYAFEQQSKARRPPSVTPPLPGETIVYNLSTTPRPETTPPSVRVRSRLGVLWRKGSWRFEVGGTVRDESVIGSLQVFVNGHQVRVTRSARWRAEIPWRKFWLFARYGNRTVNVTVIAKDIHGNTGASNVQARIPRIP
jgi:amidase